MHNFQGCRCPLFLHLIMNQLFTTLLNSIVNDQQFDKGNQSIKSYCESYYLRQNIWQVPQAPTTQAKDNLFSIVQCADLKKIINIFFYNPLDKMLHLKDTIWLACTKYNNFYNNSLVF